MQNTKCTDRSQHYFAIFCVLPYCYCFLFLKQKNLLAVSVYDLLNFTGVLQCNDTHREKSTIKQNWFGWLVHQIKYLLEVLKLKQNFQKNNLCPFRTSHFICRSVGFWQGSFVWKWRIFNLSNFNKKTLLQFFEKDFFFSEYLFQS